MTQNSILNIDEQVETNKTYHGGEQKQFSKTQALAIRYFN